MPTVESCEWLFRSNMGQRSTTKDGESDVPTGISPSDSDERKSIHGIEINRQIVFTNWQPGKEYIKDIFLKNVTTKSVKIRFRSPKTRFYSTLFPKMLSLSAGISFTLPITFRPLEKVRYKDGIMFDCEDGHFSVPVLAVLPETKISFQDVIDFRMCAVLDRSTISFTVRNIGDLDTTLEWLTQEPFSINPPEVFIKSLHSCQFTATFKPEKAEFYQLEAVCLFDVDKKQGTTFLMKGIGKYPYLLISSTENPFSTHTDCNGSEFVVSFGTVPVGSRNTKYIHLHNSSPVKSSFSVKRDSIGDEKHCVFHFPKHADTVPAMSSLSIPVIFVPNFVGLTSVDYLHLVTIGNHCKTVIKCTGTSQGPAVQLSQHSINFMQIDQHEAASRVIEVINTSATDATYQFMIDNEQSVFSFQPVSGTVPSDHRVSVAIAFTPFAPINFYRSITCLIHNQGPLFLDLLGTCHSDTRKPAVLLSKHVERYHTLVLRGLSLYAPEQLNDLNDQQKLAADGDGCLYSKLEEDNRGCFCDGDHPFDDYFNDGFHSDIINSVIHISADINIADFSGCRRIHEVHEKTINITNHTRGKVVAIWNSNARHVFTILPVTLDIPPFKSCSFRVTFQPLHLNKLYGEELECYVYCKSLRDYRLVRDSTHFPPWCVTLTCTGNTFQPNHMPFTPCYRLDSRQVVFNAVSVKRNTYRTVLLENSGTTPIMFHMTSDSDRTFVAKPSQGLILSKGHQIFVIRASLDKAQTYEYNMLIHLNGNAKYNETLHLFASAETPDVLLDNQGCMYFKPTCVGTKSSMSYAVRNLSRLPLRFQWHVKRADAKRLAVHPECGVILPNESQDQTWCFSPDIPERFAMKPRLVVCNLEYGVEQSKEMKKEYYVRVMSEGVIGNIQTDKAVHEFGDVVVGRSLSQRISLFNDSLCSLFYRLHVDQNVTVSCSEMALMDSRPGLELDRTTGCIPARSKHVVIATVRPPARKHYCYSVSYQLVSTEGDMSDFKFYEQQHLFDVLVTGVYPSLTVSDVTGSGCLASISKKLLWKLFSVDSFNDFLDCEPSPQELMYNAVTRQSHNRRIEVYSRAIFDFNFCSAPVGSEPCIVSLVFENTGAVLTDWVFLFPSDLQLELDYWAESGQFDEDELHEMRVMDNKLFSVSPKKGYLKPGANQTVTFTYHHTMTGTDRLPVLLKVAGGREIMLTFVGVTVDTDRPYIHFCSNRHSFAPMPIGEKVYPKQVYELYNGGAIPLNYQVDVTPLSIVRMENFDQPIFECLNTSGEIHGGRSVLVEWRFSPLEAKTYITDVPIRIHNGDTAIITFTGVGYDKRVMGESMPTRDTQDMSKISGVRSSDLLEKPFQLSTECVSFGNMPLFSGSRRIVSVVNQSVTHPMSFCWHATAMSDSKVVSISPQHGIVAPGSCCTCQVCFEAVGLPSFYDIDLICEVMEKDKMDKFETEMSLWKNEQSRQAMEFTITEKDLEADRIQSTAHLMDRHPSGHLQSLDKSLCTTAEKELSHYRTLPPIDISSRDEQVTAQKDQKNEEDSFWVKPSPPFSSLLHLRLTARTHELNVFQLEFPDEYLNFCIDRSKCAATTLTTTMSPSMAGDSCYVQCSMSESFVISNVMCNVLRGLLDDKYFIDAIKRVKMEPVPYFIQFRNSVVASKVDSPVKSPGLPSSDDGIIGSHSERTEDMATKHIVLADAMAMPSTLNSHVIEACFPSTNTKQQSTECTQPKHQSLRKLPEVGRLLESILDNTLVNLVKEAVAGDYNITARRCLVALPLLNTAT